MSLRTALITTATLASLACFAGQDPRIDYAFAAPKLDDSQSTVTVEATTDPAVERYARPTNSKRVSASFKGAAVSDVLAWLQKQGVSFIVDDATLASKHVTVNIVNQPLDSVVDALAASLGGHWENRSGIRVFRKGATWFGSIDELPAVSIPSNVQMHIKSLKDLPTIASTGVLGFGGDPFDQGFAQKLSKDLEEQLKGAKTDDPAFWEKFAKELQDCLTKDLGARNDVFVGASPSAGTRKAIEKARSLSKVTAVASDSTKLLKSLTPDQKALAAKQGYLKLSDLTDEQRGLLSIKGDADVEIKIVSDGDSITIKSK